MIPLTPLSRELFERFCIVLTQYLNRAIDEIDSELGDPSSLVQNSAPKLIVEEMDLARHADPDGCAGSRNRQSARCQVRRVTDLSRHLQNPMPRGLLDSAAAMQGSVYCSN